MRHPLPTLASLLVLLAAVPLAPRAAAAGDPVLELPVACEMGTVCNIQNYFDHDPGPGRMDYACGRLGYDGHDGTDIRVPDIPTMERGVTVVAAAPGVVKALRDEMDDISIRKTGKDAVKGREAGNGVVIDHGGGWETQYSHLKRGSILVTRGQRVEAGDPLGLIGLSGMTEFPHVEFAVRHDGEPIDPFVGEAPYKACGDARRPLWSAKALAQLDYRPTGPLIAGFATVGPDGDAAQEGAYAAESLPASAPALVLWAEVFGTLKGDVQRFQIEGPDGQSFFDHANPLEKSNVQWFAYAGRKRPPEGWTPGVYKGTYTLSRDGKVIVTLTREVTIEGGT
jgi:murein DD-endopeptidase MepM/ murein hydrolase activator NlpD